METKFRTVEVRETRSPYSRFELDNIEELDSRHLVDDPTPTRLRGQPPPVPTRLKAELETMPIRLRAQPPPIPSLRAALPATDYFIPGGVLPKAPATLGWAIPRPRPSPSLRVLELAQAKVETRALSTHDAKSWYTTAAFEIRRAQLSGDTRLLHSARLSLDFAEKASNSLRSRMSGDRQLHHFNIRALREIVDEKLNTKEN